VSERPIVYNVSTNVSILDFLQNQPSQGYRGRCYFTICNFNNPNEIVYGKGKYKDLKRMVDTNGRYLWEWFRAPDTNLDNSPPKWLVVQQEAKAKEIKELTITVWPLPNKKT